jgi:hypothetical protein
VFNGTPLLGGIATGGKATDALRAARISPAAPAVVRLRGSGLAGWLGSFWRLIGRDLYRATDQEARWRDWRVTERWGGLARSYRDARFSARAAATRTPPSEDIATDTTVTEPKTRNRGSLKDGDGRG